MTRAKLIAFALCALSTSATVSASAAQTTGGVFALGSDALAYMVATEQNDLFSIIEGRMAAQRAPTAELRAYGARSAQAHVESTRLVGAAARASGVAIPVAALSSDQQRLVRELRQASASDFAKVFLEQHRDLNRETIELQRGYAAGGANAALRRIAGRLAEAAQDRASQLQALEP